MPDATETMNTNGKPSRGEKPDRDWIKAEAKRRRSAGEGRQTVKELLALAQQNDPFYQGTKTDHKKADWFADVFEQMDTRSGAVHLRRVHYWCVSQRDLEHYNGEPYQNTDAHWAKLVGCAKKARYLGSVPFEKIADHRNPDPHVLAEYEFSEPTATVHTSDPRSADVLTSGFHAQDLQPYHLEVWCEKSTMNDVLVPVCRSCGANLVTGVGELSITACHELAERIRAAGKPARIFYVSDFDPAGKSMPRAVARKLEWMLAGDNRQKASPGGADVRLCPLALSEEQVRTYDLPRKPIKKSELRRSSFEEVHGEGAVELDALEALHPGALRDIVEEALGAFFDSELAGEVRQARRKYKKTLRERIEKIQDDYAEALEAVWEMNERIEKLKVENPAEYVPDAPAPQSEGDRAFPWLLDAARSYFEQLNVYDDYANGISSNGISSNGISSNGTRSR